MSPEGTKIINDRIEITPNIFYFSYPYNSVKETKSGKIHFPSYTKFPFLSLTSALMIKDIKSHSDTPESKLQLYNDGLVDTFSATHPHDEPHCVWDQQTKIKPGIWHIMPITQGDHGTAIGLFESKETTKKFYEDLTDIIFMAEKACDETKE